MKLVQYSAVEPTRFNGEQVKGVDGRVVIGKADGAANFCMRVFEVAPGGFTPKHCHDWEHEMFYHAGSGEVFCQGAWHPVSGGSVAFIPPGSDHQVRNTGSEPLVFVCLIPPNAPEL